MPTTPTGTTTSGTYTYDPGYFNTIGTGSTISTAPHPVIPNVYNTGVVSQLTSITLGGFNGLNN